MVGSSSQDAGPAALQNEGMFADYRRAAAFPRELIHPAIVETVWPALARGDHDAAVFQAFRAVEEAVREAGGHGNADYGVDLMRAARPGADASEYFIALYPRRRIL